MVQFSSPPGKMVPAKSFSFPGEGGGAMVPCTPAGVGARAGARSTAEEAEGTNALAGGAGGGGARGAGVHCGHTVRAGEGEGGGAAGNLMPRPENNATAMGGGGIQTPARGGHAGLYNPSSPGFSSRSPLATQVMLGTLNPEP